MKFARLEIDNFLAIGKGIVSLEDRGLVAIQGRNEDDSSADSNGAGKSSIADALCWALYGTTARGVSGDDVINTKAGKGTRVAVIVEDGVNCYRIERFRKHKTGKNSLKLWSLEISPTLTVKSELTLGTDKLTQERLERLLGCSYDVFRAAVYAGQEEMPDLPAMTDKNLKMLVEEAAGITILERAYEEARKRLGMASEKVEFVKAQIDRIAVKGQAIDEQIADADRDAVGWEKNREDRIAERKNLAATAVKNGNFMQTLIDKQPATAADLATKIAELDAKIAAVATERDRERTLQSELTAAERDLASWDRTLEFARMGETNASNAVRALHGKVGCPCSECQQPLTAESIEPAVKAAKARLDSAVQERVRAVTAQADAYLAAENARSALETHRKSMTDVSAAAVLRGDLTAALGVIETQTRERDRYFSEVKEHVARAKEIRAEENPHTATAAKARASRAAIDEQIQKGNEALAGYVEEQEILNSVVKVFGPGGVRAHILDDVTPFLNAQTSHYLTTLSDGAITAVWTTLTRTAKGELREKFAIEVTNSKGGQSFGALSGGEKRKVRIAAALALQDLVARRASKPIDLFIGDEIDDALDPAGLERLMTILEEKARERGTVLIVSHRDLADWVSKQITIVKTGGVSAIEELVE